MTLALGLALIYLGIATVTGVAIAQHARLQLKPTLNGDPPAAGHTPAVIRSPAGHTPAGRSLAGHTPAGNRSVSVILTPHPGLDTTLATRRLLEQPPVGQIVIVVGEADAERADAEDSRVHVLPSAPVPTGWATRRWTQQQGLRHADAGWVVLLDGDLELVPGTLSSALADAEEQELDWLSIKPIEAHPAGVKGLLAAAAMLLRSVGDLLGRNRELTTAALLVRQEAITAIGGVERSSAREQGDGLIRQALETNGYRGAARTGHTIRAHRLFGWREQVQRLNGADTIASLSWIVGVACGGVSLSLVWGAADTSSTQIVGGVLTIATGFVASTHFWALNHYNRAASWLPVSLGLAAALTLGALTAPLRRKPRRRAESAAVAAWTTGVE